jgi:hypothetical protein
MFRLNYPVIIRELIVVDNEQLVASHRMVLIYMLQSVCYVCRFKIIKQYLNTIFNDKIYKMLKKAYLRIL